MSQNQQEQSVQTPPQEEAKADAQFVDCDICGKKIRANMYKRHMASVHGFITKEEFAKMKEEVEKAIQSTIHSALQEHVKSHYKSLKELLEEGERHAMECPQCKNELEEWLKRKRQESYKKGKRLW